jgi:hypothetical protein
MVKFRAWSASVLLVLAFVLASCGLPGDLGQATPPTIAITAPVDGQQVEQGQEIAIQFTATDAQGVARVEIGVDGVLLQTALNPSPAAGTPFSGQQTWTATAPGSHSVMAVAYNSAGTASSPAVVSITVLGGRASVASTQEAGPGESGTIATATWTPIVPDSDTPLPPPTPMPTNTAEQATAMPTDTAEAPPAPTSLPQPTATVKPTSNGGGGPARPAAPGPITDFETFGTWKRGDQPNGTFTQSSEQVHGGAYAGKLAYDFPTGGNDFVVFLQTFLLGGEPNEISAWVYGDGSKHYLNVWIRDANAEIWQFSLGQVKHSGWQQMTAWLDPAAAWPAGHIDGPSNGVIDYPIDFRALVLDDIPDSYSGSGAIYVDDLRCDQGAAPQPTATTKPPADAASIRFWADETTLASGNCTRLHWEVQHVREVYLDGEGVVGEGQKKVCPTATKTYVLRVVHLDGKATEHPVTIEITTP